MTNSNAFNQKIDDVILKIQNIFNKIKSDNNSKAQTELLTATETMKGKLDQKLHELSPPGTPPTIIEDFKKRFDDQISHVINTLNTAPNIDAFNQEIDAFMSQVESALDALSAGQDLAGLKQEISNWKDDITKQINELISLAESNQKTDTLIANVKTALLQPTKVPVFDEGTETLIKELKTKLTELLPTQLPELEGAELLRKIDNLTAGIKSRNDVSQLNQIIDDLIEQTKSKVVGFPPELDRQVQGELAKLINILGIAQIQLKTNSSSEQIASIKAVVDYVQIAISALTGQPNLILSQKLRYAAKARLRKMQGGRLRTLAGWRDDFFHSIKIPTKVLIGLLAAIPVSWVIVNSHPVRNLFHSVPSLKTSPEAKTSTSPKTLSRMSKDEENFLILLLMTGTLGGVVSILTRIQDFDNPKNQKYDDDFLPFVIGLVKPILGGSFAFFIFLLLNSGVSPIQITGKNEPGKESYLYGLLALAFVAGFSERFVPDLISNVEKATVPSSSASITGLPQTSSPTTPTITPATVPLLSYGASQPFTIAPLGEYKYHLEPDLGTITTQTNSGFIYQAPTARRSEDPTTVEVIITASSSASLTTTATVTLIA